MKMATWSGNRKEESTFHSSEDQNNPLPSHHKYIQNCIVLAPACIMRFLCIDVKRWKSVTGGRDTLNHCHTLGCHCARRDDLTLHPGSRKPIFLMATNERPKSSNFQTFPVDSQCPIQPIAPATGVAVSGCCFRKRAVLWPSNFSYIFSSALKISINSIILTNPLCSGQ